DREEPDRREHVAGAIVEVQHADALVQTAHRAARQASTKSSTNAQARAAGAVASASPLAHRQRTRSQSRCMPSRLLAPADVEICTTPDLRGEIAWRGWTLS